MILNTAGEVPVHLFTSTSRIFVAQVKIIENSRDLNLTK